MGIRLDSSKEGHGYDCVHVWLELLENLREYGMKDELLYISGGLKNMRIMFSKAYPYAVHFES